MSFLRTDFQMPGLFERRIRKSLSIVSLVFCGFSQELSISTVTTHFRELAFHNLKLPIDDDRANYAGQCKNTREQYYPAIANTKALWRRSMGIGYWVLAVS
jgi:hypothetical protein